MSSDIKTLTQKVESLERDFFALQSQIVALVHAPVEPEYLRLTDAARLAGKTKKAIQHLLSKDGANPNGIHPRRICGAVHAQDWRRFLEAKHLIGRGESVKVAMEVNGHQ